MLISKQNRRAIYDYLFKEGVLVVRKDFNQPKNNEIDVPNLQVIKAMQSLKSRGYVTEQFSWQWYYYFLTAEGVEYLRQYLHLPMEIVPSTHVKTTQPPRLSAAPRDERRERRDDDGYRRRDGDKKAGAGADFKPEFRGGLGRGRVAAEAQ